MGHQILGDCAKAWNAGIKAATGDLLYCISSETVQDQGNIEKARAICEDGQTVVFGACHNSEKTNLVVGAEPGLLVSSKMTRPLGFIVCMPAWAVKKIEGYDEGFMGGFWYDDDDFFLLLGQEPAIEFDMMSVVILCTSVAGKWRDGSYGAHLINAGW